MRRPGLPKFLQRRGALLFITTAFFTVGMMLLHSSQLAYQTYEWQARDALEKAGRKAPLDPNVVVLAIDNASTQLDELWGDELEQSPALQLMKRGYPFNRAVYALLIERLVAAGAKVVAFDMEFPAPREGDTEFRAALDKYRDRVVFGCNLIEADRAVDDRTPIRAPTPELIDPEHALTDRRVGFVNFRADRDYLVRRTVFRTTTLDWHFPGQHLAPTEGPGSEELLSLAARIAQQAGMEDRIPRDRNDHLFRWTRRYYPISLYTVFVPKFWDAPPLNKGALFKDKIVFVGPYGNWTKDELETPLGLTPGPHVHLSALNALIHRDYLRETSLPENLALIFAGGALAWLLGIVVRGAITRLFLLLVAVVGYGALALVLYNWCGFFPILLSPVLALVLSGGTWLGLERLVEFIERMQLRRTLESFVSRDVVREMLDNKESYLNTMGGARKSIAVLISDVRGFTTYTETAKPELLVAQLREYFTAMVRIVFGQLGTLDKFIGDAVLASWGSFASRGPAADAAHAISAAMEMLREVPKLNAKWKARGWAEFRIGIGVTYGEAICGFMGSEEKREFTSIGDTVNLASRLEGATKEFHQSLLIGEGAAELVRDQFVLRTVALIRVKGRVKPVECFTVLDLPKGSARPAWLDVYESGVQRFRDRDFAGAESDFVKAAELNPQDLLIGEYLQTTREYQANPPHAEWDAVFTMATK